MLDASGLDCAMYGCWKPIRAFVRLCAYGRNSPDNELGVCEDHARDRTVTRWLES